MAIYAFRMIIDILRMAGYVFRKILSVFRTIF